MSPMAQMLIVFKKEVKDAFRDRRAIMTIVLSAALSPALLGFMLNRVADRQRQLDDVSIPIVGMQHAPALIDWLRQQTGVTVKEGPADAETAVRESREDVVVIIPDDFQKKFSKSAPAAVRIVADGSRQTAKPKIERTRRLFQRYSGEIGSAAASSRPA